MVVTHDVSKSGDDVNKHINIGSSSELNLSFGDTLYLYPNDTSGSPIVTIKLNDLKDTYNKVDGSAVFNLHKNINSLTQNGASLVEYYNNLKSLWKQFDVMVSLPPYTCEAAKHFEQHNQLIKLMKFLMGLDESYLAIRSNILTREPLPLVKAAFAVVRGEESHIGATKPTATAFVAKTFDNKRRFNNNNNRGSGSNTNSNNRGPNLNLKCTNFYKIGHTVDKCFELVGYPAGYMRKNFNANTRPVSSNNASASADVHSNNVSSNNATTSNSHVSLFNEQLARLMSLLNDNGVSTANANMAGKSFNFLMVVFKFNLNFKRYFNGNTNFLTGNLSLRWIVDSGANQHMIVSTKFLINVAEISNLGLTVGHPNGTQALINNIGDLKINNDITLYDVFVAPEFKGKKGLWGLTLWHQRLGYSADQVLDVLKTTLNIDSHSTSDHLWELPLYLWSESILVAVYIINMIPSYVLSGKSPFSFVFRDDPSLSHFRDFSCLCYATILNNQDKFSSSKYREIGENGRYKARLVTKGFNQREGIDFDETFSPVVKMYNVKCFIALFVKNKWPLFQVDVNNDFLYRDLEEDVHMTIPQGFADKDNKNKSADDHSLFTKSKDNKFIALLVYVDDIVVIGNCVNEIDKFKSFLKSKKYYLGLLKEYGLLGCKPISTPIEPNFVLPYIATSEDPLLDNITAYEIIWIQKLLFNLKTKVTLPVNLFCDNKSALQLAANPIFHERSKHFEIDVHFIREKKLQKGF
ncbi:ribonuclease H-like domain-containing protein [Tanacetum coccineum]